MGHAQPVAYAGRQAGGRVKLSDGQASSAHGSGRSAGGSLGREEAGRSGLVGMESGGREPRHEAGRDAGHEAGPRGLGSWTREHLGPRDPVSVGAVRAGMPGWIRRHGWFLGVLGLGALLRLVTVLGYRPALWFPDSYTYVVTAMRPRPDLVRPAGYSMFLRLFEAFHSFALVVTVQHVLGLLVGVMVYTTVLRRGGPRWAVVLASVPVLLDAYQIELEHLVVSDSLFAFLVVAAVCVAMRRPLTPLSAAALGLVLAAATLTRTVGLPLIAVFACFLLAYGVRRAAEAVRPGEAGRRGGADRRGGAGRPGRAVGRLVVPFLVAALLPVAGYAGWFYATYERLGLVGSNGVFLYARTMSFADCSVMDPPADVAVLCDSRPPGSRPTSQEYIWSADSPLVRLPGITFTKETDTLAGRFASLAIRSQPLDYLRATLTELGRSFTLGRPVYPDPETYGYYRFPATVPPPPGRHPAVVGEEFAQRYEQGPLTLRIAEPYAGWMRAYQRVAWLPGAALLAVLLVPPAAWAVRARTARRTPGDAAPPEATAAGRTSGEGAGSTSQAQASEGRGSSGAEAQASQGRATAAGRMPGGWGVAWGTAWALLLVPPATAQFDYRYVLPAVPLACMAAALALRPAAGRRPPPSLRDADQRESRFKPQEM